MNDLVLLIWGSINLIAIGYILDNLYPLNKKQEDGE